MITNQRKLIREKHLEELGFEIRFDDSIRMKVVFFDGYVVSVLYPGYIFVDHLFDGLSKTYYSDDVYDKLQEVLKIAQRKKFIEGCI